ncbi:acetoacetate decarboxylase family protein [Gordonia spumicola]|uniref:acetoacetate decarboxylase family protein n=1 Tax=Gordonia spumicola TaxID=589161 RepID=UPI001E65464C|nr:acetoacetate decarboxylase family protein [Gordonia spumicola]
MSRSSSKRTPEFVRSVLPPDLEPVGSSGIASVAQWQCGLSGEFESAAVMLNVRWREFVGSYYLTLFISGDMPVTIGRDLWGEPKKTGECRLYRDADDMYGYGARNGVRGIQIEARFGEELGPRAVVSNSIEVGLPLTHNAGAAGDPWISIDRIERELGAYREGEGELVLTGTPFDPLDEIPVLSTGLARHYTGKSTLETVLRETIPGKGDEYLPFHLGRSFDKINVGRSPMRERSADVR